MEQGQAQPLAGQDVRDTVEYQVAWELEIWRRSKQAEFESRWKKTETDRLKTLEEEWKRREIEREKFHKMRQADIVRLEKKLKQAIHDIETKVRDPPLLLVCVWWFDVLCFE